MNSKDVVLKIHDVFFLDMENIPSNEVVIELYNENTAQINDCLQDSKDEIFPYALRIKSEYCFCLSEKNENELLTIELNKTMPYFDLIYESFDNKMNNAFFIKLFYHKMRMHYINSEYEKAEKDIKNLILYFPENKNYRKWLIAIQKKKNPISALINRFFKI